MSQAAAGHAFHLPVAKALQAVTSIPAAALGLSHRVGYVRAGYDADIVVVSSAILRGRYRAPTPDMSRSGPRPLEEKGH